MVSDNLENKKDGKENFSNQKEILERDIKDSRESDMYRIEAKII